MSLPKPPKWPIESQRLLALGPGYCFVGGRVTGQSNFVYLTSASNFRPLYSLFPRRKIFQMWGAGGVGRGWPSFPLRHQARAAGPGKTTLFMQICTASFIRARPSVFTSISIEISSQLHSSHGAAPICNHLQRFDFGVGNSPFSPQKGGPWCKLQHARCTTHTPKNITSVGNK